MEEELRWHTPLHRRLGHVKMLSRAVTCTPASIGTSSLGLGRTKDGSLLYNFLAGPSAAPAPAPTLGPILSLASSSSMRRPVRSS